MPKLAFFLLAGSVAAQAPSFSVPEATIAQVHEGLRTGRFSCRELVSTYLQRIQKYDQSSALNAIVTVSSQALETAAALDAEWSRSGRLRPLHCVPLIVKDNYQTLGLQTSAGSAALQNFIPPVDAYQVRVLREAGAIVLAKSNMAEWAFSPYETVSSIAGITRNPYDLERVPAGSSGGTAAAVAANFGLAGLGTDTGNSIRGPSSHCALVGIRSTIGVTSRHGIVPLHLRNDIGGPMTRSVEDAVRIFEVIAGPDPADPVTERSRDRIPSDYRKNLNKGALRGARLGVLREIIANDTTDPEIRTLFERALEDLKRLGADIVDPFEIPRLAEHYKNIWCDTFRHDLESYLAGLGERAPVGSVAEILDSGRFSESIRKRLESAASIETAPARRDPPCLDVWASPQNEAFRRDVLEAMDRHRVDALVFPTWNNPPRKVGDLESPHGNNSPYLAPHTGQPAVTIPMGWTSGRLPAGLQLLGRPFGEAQLFGFAYAYERGTLHRRPPPGFP